MMIKRTEAGSKDRRVIKFEAAVSPATFFDALVKDSSPLLDALATVSFDYFLEFPPYTVDSLASGTAEFVCVEHTGSFRAADDAAFREHFGKDEVVAFRSLGKDAVLIAPSPIEQVDRSAYAFLRPFVEMAPRKQQMALLKRAVQEYLKRLEQERIRLWLSTSGLGVPWLHVRVDMRPKYYTYGPYKQ